VQIKIGVFSKKKTLKTLKKDFFKNTKNLFAKNFSPFKKSPQALLRI